MLKYKNVQCTFVAQAISNPQADECQNKAWAAVLPLVAQLKTYFDFANTLGESFDLAPLLNNVLGL
jgi:CYRIA/CYRIB Rac1 binding domain